MRKEARQRRSWKEARNCWCVLGMRLAAKMLNIFIDIFVALYLWDLSGGSVPTLCKYYITFVLCIYSTMLVMAPLFSKKRGRKAVLIAGRLFQVFYLITVYKLGTSCVNHVVVLGAINGIANGMYYCIYNLYEAEGIGNEIRTKAMGKYGALECIASVSFPIAAGIVIERYGMQVGLVVAIAIAVFSTLIASLYTDNGPSIGKKFSFKDMLDAASKTNNGNSKVKIAFLCDLCRGLVNSYGSFDLFIQVWTIVAFSTATSVGAISGISTGFKMLFSLVFAKWGNNLHKKNMAVYMVLRIAVVASLINMGLTSSVFSLMVMTLAMKCSNAIESPVYSCGLGTTANSGDLSNYKSEFYVMLETSLTVSRIAGYAMLWMWGYLGNWIALFACIFVYSIILLITPIIEDKLYRMAYSVKG